MVGKKILVNRNPIFGKCPKCKAIDTLHRSRPRKITERILSLIPVWKIYRCKTCGWRGYRMAITFSSNSLRLLFLYGLLILITAFVVRLVLSYVIK